MHHVVSAVLERLAQQRRQRCGVHRHLGGRAVRADERRHGANVDHLPRRVGRGLDPHQAHAAGRRPLLEHGLELREVRVLLHLHVDVGGVGGGVLADRKVAEPRQHQAVARLEQRTEHRVRRCDPRGEEQAALRALQRREHLLRQVVVRAVVPRVDPSVDGRVGVAVTRIGRRGVDRRNDLRATAALREERRGRKGLGGLRHHASFCFQL
jgi:hypothetical protein